MGIDGPEDVCLGMWWDELNAAVAALARGQSYRFDPCVQGIPAFFFERNGSTVHLSLVTSMTDAEANG